MPRDIDPNSHFRLPLLKREELDDAGKATLDHVTGPQGRILDLHGPVGVLLYSTRAMTHQQGLNRYLRFESGIDPRTREVAILTAAREADSQFEWVQHEAIALREGVAPEVIDVIRHRKPVEGLAEKDAAVIAFGRQVYGDHKVTPEMFATMKALFGPHMLVDLVILMGNYVAMAGLLTAVDLQLRPGQQPALPVG